MTHFDQGLKYGLPAVKNKYASKYDHQAEEDLRKWIEEVTGFSIGTNFQWSLKNGIILCELINKLEPGSVKTVNVSLLHWPQLENISNFIKAVQAYGVKPPDVFEENDLYDNENMTRVRSTLLALADLAKTKGFHTTIEDSIKHSENQARSFDEEPRNEENVIDSQKETNRPDGQVGMTAFGTREYLYDSLWTNLDKLFDMTTIELEMDTNKGTRLAGKLAQGAGVREDVYLIWRELEEARNTLAQIQKVVDDSMKPEGSGARCGRWCLWLLSNLEPTNESRKQHSFYTSKFNKTRGIKLLVSLTAYMVIFFILVKKEFILHMYN
uniref:Calponin-homology (CH) domain-containing protein n=1 Tax=Sarcophilus harrisii TaxID=9305 RepID=A0A7N4P0D9_SARHA